MASRKMQQRLAKGTKRLEAAPEEQPDEVRRDEGPAMEAQAQAFEEMLKGTRERQEKAEAEAKARYDRQVAASERFTAAVEKLADALEHVAVRIAFDHGVKQAEARPTRAERADPRPMAPLANTEAGKKPELPEPKAAAKSEPHPSSGRPDVEPATMEDVRALVRAAVKAGHGHEAVELLAKYKAESVSDLKPADLPAAYSALAKLAG